MSRRETLTAIYALYEQWAGAFTFACREGCATCCTRSVTMTTLEGELIYEYLTCRRPGLLPLLESLPANSPRPLATTNQFAAACLRGEDMGEDPGGWDLAPCVFLQDGRCAIYPVRSFMCRSFGSRVRCAERGEAEVEPLFLALNTMVLQCIEHLDQGRPWGNLNTLLHRLAAGGSGGKSGGPDGTLISQALPGFLLLPEEEAALGGKMQNLLHLLHKGEGREGRRKK